MMNTADEAGVTSDGSNITQGAESGGAIMEATEGEEEVDPKMFTEIFSSSRPKDALDGTWKGAGNVLKGKRALIVGLIETLLIIF